MRADVNPGTAQLGLPLDHFGMTLQERRAVASADLIETGQCLAEKGFAGLIYPEDLEGAAKVFYRTESMPDWLFGFWSEDYLAEHGIDGEGGWFSNDGQPRVHGMDPTVVAQLTKRQMAMSNEESDRAYDAYEECKAQGSGLWQIMPSSTEDEVQVLHEGDFQAYANTIETAQYSEILAAWNQCVTDAGYALKAGENFSVDNTNMAEPEQKAAALAEARCHDQLGSIQQLADIMAGFEQEYITQHEAELQKVRDKAVAMVNRAKHILTAAKLDYLMEDR